MPQDHAAKTPQTNCRYDLGFPFHRRDSAKERLAAIERFMEANGYNQEFLLSGDAVEDLEQKIAQLFGKEAAIWCVTGTMAQSIAVRIYADRRGKRGLLLHPTSHILLHEEEGYRHVHGLEVTTIGDPSAHLIADDLLPGAACACIELPQRHTGGTLPSWQDLEAIKVRACDLGLPLHVDGARLWSARPYYDSRSYAEIVDGFSSVYVSLYKDIGALGGALLLGDRAFIEEAKLWRTRMGGLAAAAWPQICDGLRLIDKRLDQMPAFVQRAQDIAAALQVNGKVRTSPHPPHTNMIHIELPCPMERAEAARDAVAKETDVWLGSRFWPGAAPCSDDLSRCRLELTIGETALNVPDTVLLEAIALLANLPPRPETSA